MGGVADPSKRPRGQNLDNCVLSPEPETVQCVLCHTLTILEARLCAATSTACSFSLTSAV